jgi:hypothetical protein
MRPWLSNEGLSTGSGGVAWATYPGVDACVLTGYALLEPSIIACSRSSRYSPGRLCDRPFEVPELERSRVEFLMEVGGDLPAGRPRRLLSVPDRWRLSSSRCASCSLCCSIREGFLGISAPPSEVLLAFLEPVPRVNFRGILVGSSGIVPTVAKDSRLDLARSMFRAVFSPPEGPGAGLVDRPSARARIPSWITRCR